MTTGATGQLGLALPVQGELSGTWGDTVNNGITQYTNIAIAATLTLTNDGAVTLANTTGDASASNIVSTLTGAGTVTAQFAIVRVTGTLTTAKVVTAPSYSKTYVVVNAATGGIVTFKASGQTGVSIAVGESAWVYFNGTDYVKLAGTVNTGVTSFQTSLSGLTPSTSTTGAVTLAGTLGTSSGGTNLTSFTSGGVVYASSTSALATGSALTFNGTELGVGVTPIVGTPIAIQAGTGNTALRLVGTSSSGTSNAGIYWYDSNNTTFNGYIGNFSTGFDFYNQRNTPIVFYTNAAEQMRLTSTGLGIGTSSPAAPLNVQKTGTGSVTSILLSRTTENATDQQSILWKSNDLALDYAAIAGVIDSGTAGSMQFKTATGGTLATKLTLDSAGNLGIGTTSPAARLGILVSGMTNQLLVGANASNSAYGSISLSGTNLDTGRIGFTGGGNTDLNLYIDVPSGGTHQFRNATTTMVTVNSAGNLKTIGTISVGNATPSTSGAGITFPASQDASSDANTLDDYEEGTWTPSVGGTATYTAQSGQYTKIGNFVKLKFHLNILLIGTGSTTTISGIPFGPASSDPTIIGGVVCYANNLATAALALGIYAQNGGTLNFFTRNTSSTGNTTQMPAIIGNSFDAYCEISYLV